MEITVQLFATGMDSFKDENVGLGRITAYLRQNGKSVKQTYLCDDDYINELRNIDLSCTIFGFSIYNTNVDYLLPIFDWIKSNIKNSIIVLGSKFATAYCHDILDNSIFKNIDAIILGDGEKTLLEIVEHMEKQLPFDKLAETHPHISTKSYRHLKSPASLDIKTLPYADRSWIKYNGNLDAYICDCHGCAGNCSFCTYGNYYDEWTGRDGNDLFREVIEIYHKNKIRSFLFTGGSLEDCVSTGKDKIKVFCENIISSGIKLGFTCYMRSESFHDNDDDKNLLKLMRKAGFQIIQSGIESGNEEDLKIYNKRCTYEDNVRMLKMLKEADIYGGAFGFVMFNPFSNWEKIKCNYSFLVNQNVANINKYISKLLIYKSTAIYDVAEKNGLIDHSQSFYKDQFLQYKFMDPEMTILWDFVYEYLYSNKTIDRIIHSNEGVITLAYKYRDIIEDGQKFVDDLKMILSRNEEKLKQYFYHLYVENNIDYGKKHHQDLVDVLTQSESELLLLHSKLLKKLFRLQATT